MKSITIYITEGKVKEHFKRNYGKYLAGAAVASLAVPEVTGALIEKSASNDRTREFNKTFVKLLLNQQIISILINLKNIKIKMIKSIKKTN